MRVVLLISDLHIGRKTKKYSVSEFRNRMKNLFKNFVCWKKQINKAYPIDALDLILLGDIVDGEEIYRGQGYETEITVDEAILLAADEIEMFLHNVLSRTQYKDVNLYCVYGNHGRANRRGSEKANWDRVLYMLLRERLDINVDIAKEWYLSMNIGGAKALIMHGDNIKMYQQIPIYGISRSVLRWRTGGIEENDFRYVFMGHFHTTITYMCNDVRVFVNGTMLDGDSYVEKMGLKPDLSFWVLIFDDDKLVSETLLSVDKIMFK